MNEPMPRIYTDPSQSKITVNLLADMDSLESNLENMPNVETEQEAELVSEYRAQFRVKWNALDKERLAMTEGSRQTTKMVNDKYNTILDRMDRCTQLADNKLLPYMQERERIRRQAEADQAGALRLEQEAERKRVLAEEDAIRVAAESQSAEDLHKAEEKLEDARDGLSALQRTPLAIPASKSVTGTLGSSTGMRKNWKYKLVDITKVPEEYLIDPVERLHKGKLNAMAKSDQENAIVPGIEFYYEDALTSRAGVVK
jgi:hypothetical protein